MTTPTGRLGPLERRQALRLGVVSGTLWSIGNGWTTGSMVTYLAQELGAQGFEVGAILAWQALVGVSRLVAPRIIRRLGGLKSAALVLLLISYGLLATLPILSLGSISFPTRLKIFIAVLCVHQLFEHLGTVAVWAWLAELAPSRLRGRYFAARQRWQLAALVPTSIAAALFVDRWRGSTPRPAGSPATLAAGSPEILAGYIVVLTAGAVFLLLSVVPLCRMPAVDPVSERRPSRVPLFAALRDSRFVRLLVCICWLSFSNGISQSAANIYPKQVLGLGLLPMVLLPLVMRLGQMGLTPWVGRFSDRYGNRPTILLCQGLVAFGPLFYLVATPAHPAWIAGAFVVWSAFAGLNVCLPNLTFRLAPAGQIAEYTAIYFGLSGLAYGISTLASGRFLDLFRHHLFAFGSWQLDVFALLFGAGWILRLLGLIFVARLREPGAWTWREIALSGRAKRLGSTLSPASGSARAD
ncbi:MAG TPA: MFS transporter [Pirellulales bacterium]|jgi:MFS family permease|nr:MFS transporter [Pirellulales bacterium]